MLNYENGKKILVLSYAAKILHTLLIVFILPLVVRPILEHTQGWMWTEYYGNIVILANVISLLLSCAVILGFLVLWVCERNFLDFVAMGILSISFIGAKFILPLFSSYQIYRMINLFLGLVAALIYVVFALKVKWANNLLFLLFGCAFVYSVAMTFFNMIMMGGSGYSTMTTIYNLIALVGSIVCQGLCIVACRMEWRNA